jgi:hypothetical protein
MSTTTRKATGREKWSILKADGYVCYTCGTPYQLEAVDGHATCNTCTLTKRKS